MDHYCSKCPHCRFGEFDCNIIDRFCCGYSHNSFDDKNKHLYFNT